VLGKLEELVVDVAAEYEADQCACVYYVGGRWGSERYKLGRQASEDVHEVQEDAGGGERGRGSAWTGEESDERKERKLCCLLHSS
jgi:hypothetical protein